MSKQRSGDKPLAAELIKRYGSLKAERDAKFTTDWQQISQYFLPQDSDINVMKTEGVTGWTDQIFDTTAIECAQTLKTGQYNWLTPPQQPWGEFSMPEELRGQDGFDEGVKWLGEASDRYMREQGRSNFYSIASLSYLGVGVFGTDFILCEEGSKTVLNYRHAKIGTYCIEEDDEGVVDTTFREYEMTFRQMKQKFNKPDDFMPEDLERQAKGAEGLKKKFKILHAIFPRTDSERIPTRKDGANKPIASITIALDFMACIRISGYEEQPAMVSRWDKWGTNSPWGYSPAYLTLPIARQLNYVQMYMDALAELHAYPRTLIPDSLDGDVDLRAGGSTTFDSQHPEALPREWATAGDYKMGLELQNQRREQMRDAWMVRAFKLLNSQPLIDKKMTAFEIAQRQAELLGDFTPTLGRRTTEWLNPLCLRGFGICYRKGIFGQAPDILMQDAGGGKKALVMPQVLITNRLTDSLRSLKNRAVEETMQFVLPIVEQTQKPELLDVFMLDDVIHNYGENAGMSPDELRGAKGKDSIESIRQARAQMMQQQRQLQAMETMGKAGAGLGRSPQFLQDQAQQELTGAGPG